jgi:hypothetical protein
MWARCRSAWALFGCRSSHRFRPAAASASFNRMEVVEYFARSAFSTVLARSYAACPDWKREQNAAEGGILVIARGAGSLPSLSSAGERGNPPVNSQDLPPMVEELNSDANQIEELEGVVRPCRRRRGGRSPRVADP